MTIKVNGQMRDVDARSTVATLLQALDWPPEGVAVAVNGRVVPRSQHAATELKEGVEVEILRAVGGG